MQGAYEHHQPPTEAFNLLTTVRRLYRASLLTVLCVRCCYVCVLGWAFVMGDDNGPNMQCYKHCQSIFQPTSAAPRLQAHGFWDVPSSCVVNIDLNTNIVRTFCYCYCCAAALLCAAVFQPAHMHCSPPHLLTCLQLDPKYFAATYKWVSIFWEGATAAHTWRVEL